MSAYDQGSLTTEGYLVRILAGLCKQAGGELRVKGELVDAAGEATTIITDWDSAKQELVIRAPLGQFSKVYRLKPETAQPGGRVITPQSEIPIDAASVIPSARRASASTIDDTRTAEQEKRQGREAFARAVRAEVANALGRGAGNAGQ